MQNIGKQSLRVIKNYTKGYSDTQTKVRDATSNDPWGPSGTQMNDLAQLSFNQQDFIEIMEMLDKRLNDKGKNWRHVWKALTVVDYLLHTGSENCILYFKENMYIIKTLKEFQYIDDNSKDEGANVRQKAKDITNLLQDDSRLREERRSRGNMQDRMAGRVPGSSNDFGENGEDENAHRRSKGSKRQRGGGDEDDLRKAIEESKRSHAVEQAKAQEEKELAEALKLSEEEEAKRNKSLEEANQRALFDDQAQSTSNNPFPLFDPSAQSQQALQPQFTAIAPQFTSYNPYAQQQQQEAMQQQYAMQQAEWMRQQQEAQAQAQQQALLQQQQEEWNRQQQLLAYQQQQQQQQQFLQAQQMSPLMPQQTSFGSNNPFALGTQGQAMSSAPSLSSTTSSSLDTFSLPSTFASSPAPNPSPAAHSPPPPSTSAPPISRPAKDDGQHAHLASLLANREDGIDSFGNIGQLRYGHANSGRIISQQTGFNPFAQQQQQQQQNNSDQPFFSV
ncbi:ENTH-domain-containing protein [Schizopora paradoxa]|uniref:ENTH-domain-containing protein n=1 Tax=Schizopora paradoxa TaxID=27342 RepID=A0A0H2RJQ1_9AGAM|nr:ENTH-domain-containing protein [Schizopora paradoxa]